MNIIPEEEIYKSFHILQENLKGNVVGPVEFTLRRKDGKKIIAEFWSYPFTFHDQTLIMGVARDVTDRKKTKQELVASENKYRTIFEKANDGIVIYNLETGKISEVNKKFCDLFKLPRTAIIDRPARDFSDYTIGLMDELTPEHVKHYATEGPQIFEVQLKTIENEPVWVELNLNLLTIDGSENVLAIIRNINERKIMENKLNALHKHSITLAQIDNMEDIIRRTLSIVKDIFGFYFTSFQIREDNDLVTINYYTRLNPDGVAQKEYLRLPIDGMGITTRAAREKRSILVNDVRDNPDFYGGDIGDTFSELAVPIIQDDKVIGVLNVESDKLNSFTLQDQNILEILANHVAAALDRVNKFENLEELIKKRTEEIKLIEMKYQNSIEATEL